MLLFSVIVLYGCRSEENALDKSNPNTEYKIIHQNYSIVQKNATLNQKFSTLESISSASKNNSAKQNNENIIEIDGIKIFKDYVTYVSPIGSSKETYSFYVENSNYRLAPNSVQNLVFSKKENETDYSAYLVTYTFPEGINNDNQNIKISKIEKLNISSFFSKKSNTVNTKLTAKTSSDCLISYTYDVIETKHACGENKHYGDSEITDCRADIKPYSTYVMKITSMYADCGTESWGTPESGSSAPGGGSGSASGSTAPSVDTSISLPPEMPTECKGGKIKDTSGNCVCPQGKEENSFGNCVTPCDTSKDDLKKLFPNANDIVLQDIANAINKYGKDFGIDTKEKLQHFLAQAGHESAKFTVFTENLNYRWEKLDLVWGKYFNSLSNPNLDPNKANPNDYKRSSTSAYVNVEKFANYVYGNRMGNNAYGDGYKYRGRGIFQLTGKNNYTAFNNFYRNNYDSSVDIINNPDLLTSNKEMMVISALWFYKNNVLNRIKVNENTSVKSVSVKVNGGTNGLNDRIQIFNIAINIIKCL